MCQEGLYILLGFTHHRMKSIKTCARTTSVMTLHGLHGKKSNNATTNTVMSKLMDHFHELQNMGRYKQLKWWQLLWMVLLALEIATTTKRMSIYQLQMAIALATIATSNHLGTLQNRILVELLL